MAFSISCMIIRLLLLTVHICANELNVLEPGTQVYPILPQDNNPAISAGSATATSENMVDYALQQHDQHPSKPNPLLLANENPDCTASPRSNIIQSSAGRSSRMRYKRGGGSNVAAVCEWHEFNEDSPETTTTPDDEQLRGKRRRPKPSPTRDPGKVGPLKNPDKLDNLAPAPYKLHREADPQQCPFGEQNIPVCYPKVAIPLPNPALIISPCRIGKCDKFLSPLLMSVRIFSHL